MVFAFKRKRSGNGPARKRQKTVGIEKPMTTKRVRSIAKTVVKNQAEAKEFFQAQDDITAPGDTSIHIRQLSNVVQGTDANNCIGEDYTPTSLHIRGMWEPQAANSGVLTRIVVFQYRLDTDKSVPVLSNMFANTSPGQGYGTNSVFDTAEVGKGRNYKILWDTGTRAMGTSEVGDTANIPNRLGVFYPWSIFVTNLEKIRYTDPANSEGRNNIWIATWSDRTNASTQAPDVRYNWRLTFKDL